MFLDQKTRGCTIYKGRPAVCRAFPDGPAAPTTTS